MDIPSTRSTQSAQETQEVGREVAYALTRQKGDRGASVLCLYGDLGSGKTTFTQGFAQGLGIQTRLLSPTFIIVRRYEVPDEIFFYHIDLYRLKKEEELEALGFAEMLADPGAIIVIEWAEKLRRLLPKDKIDIHFRVSEDGTHEITISN